MSESARTRPDEITRDAERAEADATHMPDRAPTPEEEEAAEAARRELGGHLEDVGEHVEEMTGRGAGQKGEGRVP